MVISPEQRTQYLRLVRQLLDRVPEGYAVSVQQQNGCEPDAGASVPVEWQGRAGRAQAYRPTPDEALVFLVHPPNEPPQIPRLVPG